MPLPADGEPRCRCPWKLKKPMTDKKGVIHCDRCGHKFGDDTLGRLRRRVRKKPKPYPVKKPKTYPVGRVCQTPKCITRLTIYNPHDHCYRHAPLKRVPIRGINP